MPGIVNGRVKNGGRMEKKMSILEIISGVLLILCGVSIIGLVLMQDSKGSGLTGTIGGGDMMENNANTPKTMLAKYTKIAAIVFFVLAILVSVISIYFAG